MLIICDFDGTITTEDVTNALWDRYGMPGWREQLLPPYFRGEMSPLEVMDAGWRTITQSKDELLAAAAAIPLRDGFDDFLAACRSRRWPMYVISGGLDWYVRALLPRDVPFVACRASLEDGWRVTLPDDMHLPPGTDFKVYVLRQVQSAHDGLPTVFIGDGHNDFQAAQLCDHVFALRGSTLARLCREDGRPAMEFDSFVEVHEWLSQQRQATPGPA